MADPSLSAAASGRPLHGHVLIIDDNQYDRAEFRRLLEDFGLTVSEASRGADGLAFARSTAVDLILLDHNMPEMDGGEVLQQLKQDTQLAEIPVLMLTGMDSENSISEWLIQFMSHGAADYLKKKGDPGILRARVTNCLNAKQASDLLKRQNRELWEQRQWAKGLLSALLPKTVADAYLAGQMQFNPIRCRDAAVMFCDVVDFTQFCEQRDPAEVIRYLHELVGQLEQICSQHGLEKIKTIGDSFMATAGMLDYPANPVLECVRCAQAMLKCAAESSPNWTLRVGIHSGSFVAGIIGKTRFQFDIWGSTVNQAARIESEGEDGAINLSQAAWTQIGHLASAKIIHRDLKGIGPRQPIYVFSRFLDEAAAARP